jgi:CO/xanthine dehydrogenase FAD-binding subunit
MRNPTSYYRPTTTAEAARLLMQPHVTAAPLSGGTFQLAEVDLPYEAVVDLQALADLKVIDAGPEGALRLGSTVTLADVAAHEAVPVLLSQVIRRTLPLNTRHGVTLYEALAYPARAAEVLAALLALDAAAVFEGTDAPRVPLADLLLEQSAAWQAEHGLLTALELPAAAHGRVWGTAHVARTPTDAAIVSVTAVLMLDAQGRIAQARLALTGAYAEPARLAAAAESLVGGAVTDTQFEAVIAALLAEVDPPADYQGSADYRRAMVGVLARRALVQCRERLGG